MVAGQTQEQHSIVCIYSFLRLKYLQDAVLSMTYLGQVFFYHAFLGFILILSCSASRFPPSHCFFFSLFLTPFLLSLASFFLIYIVMLFPYTFLNFFGFILSYLHCFAFPYLFFYFVWLPSYFSVFTRYHFPLLFLHVNIFPILALFFTLPLSLSFSITTNPLKSEM